MMTIYDDDDDNDDDNANNDDDDDPIIRFIKDSYIDGDDDI